MTIFIRVNGRRFNDFSQYCLELLALKDQQEALDQQGSKVVKVHKVQLEALDQQVFLVRKDLLDLQVLQGVKEHKAVVAVQVQQVQQLLPSVL